MELVFLDKRRPIISDTEAHQILVDHAAPTDL